MSGYLVGIDIGGTVTAVDGEPLLADVELL